MVADAHQAFVYVIVDGLSAEHLLSWEITFFHSFAYAGINGDTKLKEAVLNMGNKFQFIDIFAMTAGIGSVFLVNFFDQHLLYNGQLYRYISI